MKRLLIPILSIVGLALAGTIGSSYYLLDYALSPDEARRDTAARFDLLFQEYPEVKPWVDSLRARDALCDTFVVMSSGERHHAFYIRSAQQLGDMSAESADTLNGESCSGAAAYGTEGKEQVAGTAGKRGQPGLSPPPLGGASGGPRAAGAAERESRVAVCIHGWRQQAVGMLHIARIYQRLGYNILVPDLHAHGLSEGETIGMGWNERKDILQWMSVAAELFDARDFILHGISMGAATTMNVSGEPLPEGVEKVRFVEDCGYTSVWDEFSHELEQDFGLSAFPLLYTSSWLCWLRYGWTFAQASPLKQIVKCPYPMLLIHGDNDHFVPSWMVHPLFEAKPEPKRLWITAGSEHDRSYNDYKEEYIRRVTAFVEDEAEP